MSKKKTKEEFIKEATEKHNGKYDYSKVEYVNSKTKVCIICPEHDEFWQTPSAHLQGQGCPKCGIIMSSLKKNERANKEFIEKAHKFHGDKYDYSKVDYKDNKTKVCIICKKHGEFWQMPKDHLSGRGCPTCGSTSALTKDGFIKKARKVHGDKYDYSKVDYVNSATKVCIICSKPGHGEFEQTPNHHLSGCGCHKCGVENRSKKRTSTKEEFIEKSKEKHGDKYDYSKVKYVDAKSKVCVVCPEHGEFWQIPYHHTKGCCCPKCGAEKKTSSKEKFIKKARKLHGDKYDYSKVEYVNSYTKVCIICPEHGEFEQMPYQHTNGSGCPKCKGDKIRESLSYSKEDFIKKANETHNDKYDYTKVEYVNANTKVCIICSKHGEFEQIPSEHIRGNGCPKCNLSHLERSVMNYLDEVKISYDYQKRFKWLGMQSLDFYLPDYNVGIECQGEQHFFPVDFAGNGVEWACKEFDKLVSRDKRKKALCEKHGIKLLYFGNVPNHDTFLGEVVHDDVQYLIDYLNEHKKENT